MNECIFARQSISCIYSIFNLYEFRSPLDSPQLQRSQSAAAKSNRCWGWRVHRVNSYQHGKMYFSILVKRNCGIRCSVLWRLCCCLSWKWVMPDASDGYKIRWNQLSLNNLMISRRFVTESEIQKGYTGKRWRKCVEKWIPEIFVSRPKCYCRHIWHIVGLYFEHTWHPSIRNNGWVELHWTRLILMANCNYYFHFFLR